MYKRQALGYPVFVTEIDKTTNTVVLGREKALERSGMVVGQLNLQKYADVPQPLETLTKVRYKHEGSLATIVQQGDKMQVQFHEPVVGVAPGQAAVFYEGDDVVGGGWILKALR